MNSDGGGEMDGDVGEAMAKLFMMVEWMMMEAK